MKCYNKKKVLVIGHTGFKGSWLVNCLNYFNADVYGISKKKINKSINYDSTDVKKKLVKEFNFDVRNYGKLDKTISEIQPRFIFYLAAQSLVGKSYSDPHETWTINFIGALNLLEILKKKKFKNNLILITSDKCYKNVEKKSGYKEKDYLGGSDPYSASKSSVEILYKSYFDSYLKKMKNCQSATARAGNVIGGGDLSENRIIPDCIKSWKKNLTTEIRSPSSTRPWQHVLEPLNGYLMLGEYLDRNIFDGESYNFGPSLKNSRSVKELIKEVKKNLINFKFKITDKKLFHEHGLLQLNCDKAKKKIKWKPKLSFKETVKFTTDWYIKYYNHSNMSDFTNYQIKEFFNYDKKI